MSFPYIMQGKNLVIVIDNQTHTITPTHPAYQVIVDALKKSDWDLVRDYIEPKAAIINYSNGHVTISDNKVMWNGTEMHNSLTTRMVEMLREGFPIDPMVAFMGNLMQNQSYRAINELYGFLEKNNLPITPEGHFLAYKKVRDSYFDVHSNTVCNKPASEFTQQELESMPMTVNSVTVDVVLDNGCASGKKVTVVTMPRNAVDDNKDRTCSSGLHFCSREYLDNFGGQRIVILKINPRDVVSIPSDYNNSKGRTCRYEIVGELAVDPSKAFTRSVQDYPSWDEDNIDPYDDDNRDDEWEDDDDEDAEDTNSNEFKFY